MARSLVLLVTGVLAGCGAGSGETTAGGGAAPGDIATGPSDALGDTPSDDAAGDTGVGDAGASATPPDCVFKPPLGAKCNPYPGCPASGCAQGQVCTLVVAAGGLRRIECAAPGTAFLGESCDPVAGPTCHEGLCVDATCRQFCVDNVDCTNKGACQPLPDFPGSLTVCGKAQADCDPLAPTGACPPGQACYWANTGTDCLEVQGGGQQGAACTCTNCCAAGFACITQKDQQFCARVCSPDGQQPDCATACGADMESQGIGTGLAVCVPGSGGPPPPPPPACDILAQDCAGAAQGCYPTTQYGDVCLQKGTTPAGVKCGGTNECVAGTACIASKCYAICDPQNPLHPECATGPNAQCVSFGGSSKGGYCDE